MSKGSKRRPTDEARFGANYDRIFSSDDNGALFAPKWVMDGLMERTRKLSDVKLKLKETK
jgi:hypothetical protein